MNGMNIAIIHKDLWMPTTEYQFYIIFIKIIIQSQETRSGFCPG